MNHCCGRLAAYFAGPVLLANCDGCGVLFRARFEKGSMYIRWERLTDQQGGNDESNS